VNGFVFVAVAVNAPLIVAVHVNVNPPVAVIDAVQIQ
jgi:hypothetical protein